jgi:hypothetical protein
LTVLLFTDLDEMKQSDIPLTYVKLNNLFLIVPCFISDINLKSIKRKELPPEVSNKKVKVQGRMKMFTYRWFMILYHESLICF